MGRFFEHHGPTGKRENNLPFPVKMEEGGKRGNEESSLARRHSGEREKRGK